jgi:hypothetical protein
MWKKIQHENLLSRINKTKQGYDKKTYPKFVLNILKAIKNSIFIYTLYAPNSRKFSKKLPIYMWPMFSSAHQCAPTCELRMN